MAKTYTIASRVHTDMRISQAMKPDAKPGQNQDIRSIVLKGAPHPDGVQEGMTEGVDAEMYDKWLEASGDFPPVLNGLLRIVPEKEMKDGREVSYGFEPALEASAKDKDEAKAQKAGSTLTDEGPVKAEDMAATTTAATDDSPRSQTPAPGGFGAGPAPAPGPAPKGAKKA